MEFPKFFVIARVVGRNGTLPLWKERLVHLCNVSATERLGDSYYWGQDLDGEPDTLWGLEGYTHPVGFFIGHVSTDIFKREMAHVDADRLLRTEQGLASPDYDLHHYDWVGGWLKRADDPARDAKTSLVAVIHFWASNEATRADLIATLLAAANDFNHWVQSFGILKEVRDERMVTLWLRSKSPEDYERLESSSKFRGLMTRASVISTKTEVHLSRAFDGHLDLSSGCA
ncbi:hypothetical protein ASPVEDRAFT_87242 [Aspergillus versicolor CBS 583.65]|uniref:ABM domain-containing protein n=1 Tax=Aspergillus versicolor CBS 583.65 TaxID=1036611 RepID=A0A1L9PWM0_ASPVE|nr:uncharacterized protein ASPVEDRAFT_87242 [Aspergillus versicolor CBS 583.65]OJJ05917.1 hypothetical protein ASPVEDRAFT_87242 [Aspergillus versicolor CBS 583.65]